jgi:hypothetical protein
MGDVASLVTGALRHKLATHGVGTLSRVEWQLLRAGTLLHALDDRTLERLLGEAPLAEVTGIADGLDAIGAGEASTLLHYTVREVRAANAPGAGRQRAFAIRDIAERLAAALGPMRAGIERQLLDFAFQQPELMADAAAPAPAPAAPNAE